MDFFTKSFPDHDNTDTITSLMNMADTMEALLPPDCDIPNADKNTSTTSANTHTDLNDVLSSVTKPQPLVRPDPLKLDTEEFTAPTLLYNMPDEVSVSALDSCSSPADNTPSALSSSTSPVSIRDVSSVRDVHALHGIPHSLISKPRKTTRKPKTYSKPVASRFCHICSRMPRRGQGSATCRRMAEGFCRKIVCEQCLREQGWDYEKIASNPGNWLCPHCSENCPPRSQCHIYNRINARRKRAGKQTSVAAALASSDVLLGHYGHLFQDQGPQILQPPPNFRLNLPPHFAQQ